MKIVQASEISTFVGACDKMIESKYIMVDKRIADVLKSIAECKPVYNLIAECMINFNFDKLFKTATAENEFMLPEDPKDLVAFVFCLLNCLDDKKININDLLMRFYAKDKQMTSYGLFNNHVIMNFRNAVYFLLVGEPIVVSEKGAESENIPAKTSVDKKILDRLAFLVKDLKDYVLGLKKIKGSYLTKSELVLLVSGFITEIEHANIRSFQSMMIGIKAGVGGDKELLKRLVSIDEIVGNIIVD